MKIVRHDNLFEFFPRVYTDNRGQFLELYNSELSEWFCERGITFVQENMSVSKKGTIRGMHFQKNAPQGKLMTVVAGSALDVVVDIREKSPTFGKKYYFDLNDKKRSMLWVPPGYAHGFQALESPTVFLYRVTEKYDPADQHSIHACDKSLAIEWKDIRIIMSEKDSSAQSFEQYVGS
jgi:dTDP-4-dehydrorhamnose 3,5-epimerase